MQKQSKPYVIHEAYEFRAVNFQVDDVAVAEKVAVILLRHLACEPFGAYTMRATVSTVSYHKFESPIKDIGRLPDNLRDCNPTSTVSSPLTLSCSDYTQDYAPSEKLRKS
ncbi:hypothetical protein EVAR_43034_1 [Eumeta japonica]|uniref:Uncharacterized protein n=1 Tax=Eumeta variegata TaxID=151549 RepID=A0A4C1XKQ0_EUMVA|nr:hypothetical protein EVAR_43034_1 [Eumeta japonica]